MQVNARLNTHPFSGLYVFLAGLGARSFDGKLNWSPQTGSSIGAWIILVETLDDDVRTGSHPIKNQLTIQATST